MRRYGFRVPQVTQKKIFPTQKKGRTRGKSDVGRRPCRRPTPHRRVRDTIGWLTRDSVKAGVSSKTNREKGAIIAVADKAAAKRHAAKAAAGDAQAPKRAKPEPSSAQLPAVEPEARTDRAPSPTVGPTAAAVQAKEPTARHWTLPLDRCTLTPAQEPTARQLTVERKGKQTGCERKTSYSLSWLSRLARVSRVTVSHTGHRTRSAQL